jgi:hypothetical protein
MRPPPASQQAHHQEELGLDPFEVRRVHRAGTFRFQTRQLFVSDTLLEEEIGREETEDGMGSIDFFDILRVPLDERDFGLRP